MEEKQEGFKIAIPFTCPGCDQGYVLNMILPIPEVVSLISIDDASDEIKSKIKYELTSDEPDAA